MFLRLLWRPLLFLRLLQQAIYFVAGTEPGPPGPGPPHRVLVGASKPRLEEGVLSGVHACLLIALDFLPCYGDFRVARALSRTLEAPPGAH